MVCTPNNTNLSTLSAPSIPFVDWDENPSRKRRKRANGLFRSSYPTRDQRRLFETNEIGLIIIWSWWYLIILFLTLGRGIYSGRSSPNHLWPFLHDTPRGLPRSDIWAARESNEQNETIRTIRFDRRALGHRNGRDCYDCCSARVGRRLRESRHFAAGRLRQCIPEKLISDFVLYIIFRRGAKFLFVLSLGHVDYKKISRVAWIF